MTAEAERSEVLQIAFTAAFGYRQDVVRVPEAAPIEFSESPEGEHLFSSFTARLLKSEKGAARIQTADGADGFIPLQNELAKIAWIGAHAPFMDTPVRAEGEAARGNFKRAPSAECASILTLRKQVRCDRSAGHASLGAHQYPTIG